VQTAGSAREAILRIATETFDVIVTDLRMEAIEAGLEVLKAAKEKDGYTQVIVITAYGKPEITAEAMREAAFDFLERNIPGVDVFEVLRVKVTEALEFKNAKLRESGVQ
jgi:DNA-binding NtrC family response regulator